MPVKAQSAHLPSPAQFDTQSPETARASLQELRRTVRRHRQDGAHEDAAWALLAMGRLLRERNDPQGALPFLNQARGIFEAGSDRFGLGCVLHEMSVVHRESDRNALALEVGREAAFREPPRGWCVSDAGRVVRVAGHPPLSWFSESEPSVPPEPSRSPSRLRSTESGRRAGT